MSNKIISKLSLLNHYIIILINYHSSSNNILTFEGTLSVFDPSGFSLSVDDWDSLGFSLLLTPKTCSIIIYKSYFLQHILIWLHYGLVFNKKMLNLIFYTKFCTQTLEKKFQFMEDQPFIIWRTTDTSICIKNNFMKIIFRIRK